MSYCTHCGASVKDTDYECPKCGALIKYYVEDNNYQYTKDNNSYYHKIKNGIKSWKVSESISFSLIFIQFIVCIIMLLVYVIAFPILLISIIIMMILYLYSILHIVSVFNKGKTFGAGFKLLTFILYPVLGFLLILLHTSRK